ncbi:MAG: hypothetical protein ACE5EH_08035 [Gammaproteobacteria bacterium]
MNGSYSHRTFLLPLVYMLCGTALGFGTSEIRHALQSDSTPPPAEEAETSPSIV